MMAFDSSSPPPRGELDPATADAMRTVIASAVAAQARRAAGEASPGGDTALHEILRRVAHEARERAIPPERLLVLIKTMWRAAVTEHRESSGAAGSDRERIEQDRRLGEVVTLCIAEYYREE